MRLSPRFKFLLSLAAIGAAGIGFMVRLPGPFRSMDKELHALFYFCAAAFFNFLFVGKRWLNHAAVFGFLLAFGAAIEYAQELSNAFFRKRIHGRFDPEDLLSNTYGLLAFSAFWVGALFVTGWFFPEKRVQSQSEDNTLSK